MPKVEAFAKPNPTVVDAYVDTVANPTLGDKQQVEGVPAFIAYGPGPSSTTPAVFVGRADGWKVDQVEALMTQLVQFTPPAADAPGEIPTPPEATTPPTEAEEEPEDAPAIFYRAEIIAVSSRPGPNAYYRFLAEYAGEDPTAEER